MTINDDCDFALYRTDFIIEVEVIELEKILFKWFSDRK